MRKRFFAAALAGVALAGGLASPASAADTVVTLTVVGAGGLTIGAPSPVGLGSGAEGGTVSGPIGPVTVLDQRAALNPTWAATVISTDFVTGSGSSGETIPNINVTYWSGFATSTAGSGTFTAGQQFAADAVIINVPRTAYSHTGGTGSNFATWNPTLIVAIPAGTVGGLYEGTVTHSVF